MGAETRDPSGEGVAAPAVEAFAKNVDGLLVDRVAGGLDEALDALGVAGPGARWTPEPVTLRSMVPRSREACIRLSAVLAPHTPDLPTRAMGSGRSRATFLLAVSCRDC